MYSAACGSDQPNGRGCLMDDHLIEEPKVDVSLLREAIQEEYAEGVAKMEGVAWITGYTYR